MIVLPVDSISESLDLLINEFQELFPKNFYLGITPATNLSDLPIGFSRVALHEVAYLEKSQAFSISVMNHIQAGTQIPREELRAQSGENYLIDMQALIERFDDQEALENAERFIDSCYFELPLHLSKYQL